jgi:hypothetical protein
MSTSKLDLPRAPDLDAQMSVVAVCHDYAVLDMHEQVGLALSRSDRETLRAMRRLLLGDRGGRRRGHRRIPLRLTVCVKALGEELEGRAMNISGGGVFVYLPREVFPGTPVEVVLGPGSDAPVHFNAVVRWTSLRAGQVGHGLRFSAVPLQRQQLAWDRADGPAAQADPSAA